MYIYIYTFFACTFAYYMHMGSCLQNLLSQYRYVYVYIYIFVHGCMMCLYVYIYPYVSKIKLLHEHWYHFLNIVYIRLFFLDLFGICILLFFIWM